MWGEGSADKLHDLLYGHSDSLGEGGNLTLKIYQKGILEPPSNYLDSAVILVGLMQGHGAARAQGERPNFVWVEPQYK